MIIRCFDLGGSGLRTCLYLNGQSEGEPRNLGASPDAHIGQWIRTKIGSLDEEAGKRAVFSFSLAGLDKLTKPIDQLKMKARDRGAAAALFNLPTEQVLTLNDGDAHLRASRDYLCIERFPHLNFSLGTGVGFGVSDEHGNTLPEKRLFQLLGCAPWDLRVSCSASRQEVSFALAADGLRELKNRVGPAAGERFEKRWVKFLKETYLPRLQAARFAAPKIVTFTGGLVDRGLVWARSTELTEFIVKSGPRNAGILGAWLQACGE